MVISLNVGDPNCLSRPKGILLVHAPTGDSELMFRGAPMSILYASSVLADRLNRGIYSGWGEDDLRLYDPGPNCFRNPAAALVEVKQLLDLHRPAVVGIGTTSYALYWALEIARTVKQWYGDCVVILGGPHEDEIGATFAGGSIAKHADLIDFSIQGDAEYLFAHLFKVLLEHKFTISTAKSSLVEDHEILGDMQGTGAISFFSAGKVHTVAIGDKYRPGLRGRGQRPLQLDELPSPPRWLLAEEHKYLFDIFQDRGRVKRTAQMLTTRGCSFACNFCSERGALSYRSVPNIMREIENLAGDGYEAVFFDDSTFHLYPDLVNLLDEFAASRDNSRMEFGCLTRVDSLLDNRSQLPLDRFADAGFTYFYMGIEHDDDAVLGEMRKGYDRAKLHACLDLFREPETRFRLGVSLLFGFKSETEDSCRRTLRLVAEHPAIALASLSIVAFHPAATISRSARSRFAYDTLPPHSEPEWDLFEEGRWFHPDCGSLECARRIHRLVREVDADMRGRLIPKLKRGRNVLPLIPHSGYSGRADAEPTTV